MRKGQPAALDVRAIRVYKSRAISIGVIAEQLRGLAFPVSIALLPDEVVPGGNFGVRLRFGDVNWTQMTRGLQGSVSRQHRQFSFGQVADRRFYAAMGYEWNDFRSGTIQELHSDDVISDYQGILRGGVQQILADVVNTIFDPQPKMVEDSTTGMSTGWLGAPNLQYQPDSRNGISFAGKVNYWTEYADTAGNPDINYLGAPLGPASGRRQMFQDVERWFRDLGEESTEAEPVICLYGPDSYDDIRQDNYFVARNMQPTPQVQWSALRDVPVDLPDVSDGRINRGGFNCIEIGGIPRGHYAFIKTYGPLAVRNPVRLFYPQDIGFGPVMMSDEAKAPLGFGGSAIDWTLMSDLGFYLQFGNAVVKPELGVVVRALGTGQGSYTWTDISGPATDSVA